MLADFKKQSIYVQQPVGKYNITTTKYNITTTTTTYNSRVTTKAHKQHKILFII